MKQRNAIRAWDYLEWNGETRNEDPLFLECTRYLEKVKSKAKGGSGLSERVEMKVSLRGEGLGRNREREFEAARE